MFSSIYQSLILAKPKTVLAILSIVLIALAIAIPKTAFDASSDSLVIEGDKDLEYAREVSKKYGSGDFLIISYTPNHVLFSEEGIARLSDIHDSFAALDAVSSVNSILDVPLLYSPKVGLNELNEDFKTVRSGKVDLDLAKKEFTTSPVYKSLLTNADATTTALQINLKPDEIYNNLQKERSALRAKRRAGDLTGAEKQRLVQVTAEFEAYKLIAASRQELLVQEARNILQSYQSYGQIFLGGVPMIAVDMVNFIKGDLKTLGLGGALVIIGLMVFFFRSVRWVAIPLLTVGITITLMLGFLATIDWRMTFISSNFVAILLVINLSILIHLVVRYRELAAADPEANTRELVLNTMTLMARPCVYTTLTTLIAFASLVISGIRPVIDFGWMMSIGVTMALINSFIILPCVLLILPREVVEEKTNDKPVTVWFANIVENYGKSLVVSVVAVIVITVFGIMQLKVENRFIDYFHKDTEIYQGMVQIDAELGGTIPLDIIIDVELDTDSVALTDDIISEGDDFADDEFFDDDFGDEFSEDIFASDNEVEVSAGVWFTRSGMEEVKRVHDYLDDIPELGKVLSLATLYEVFGDLAGKDVDDIQLVLAKQNLPEIVNEVMVLPYYDEANQQVRISVRAKETSRDLNRNELIKKIKKDLVEELGFDENRVHLSGLLVLYNNMLQSLYKSQILTLGTVFIAIMFMFFILFRSASLAIIAIFPNLLAATVVLGGMGIAGVPLDMMTITIAAICIGIGVDDTVHYIHRFKEEFAHKQNYIDAMYRSHASIGKAMYYTSVIIVVGFGVLALSNFKPTIYFGLLTGMGMVAALLGALLILPRLILLFKPFGPEKV